MTLPSTDFDLRPAPPDEIRGALKALFDQFPSADGDPTGKLLGYLDALSREPKWAIVAAVRRFLHGEVSSHDGRFLPTSAELARAVREETAFARRIAEREARRRSLKLEDKSYENPVTRAKIERGFEQLGKALEPAAAAARVEMQQIFRRP